MKKQILLACVALFEAVSCGTTSKITLDTNMKVDEAVTVREEGTRETKTYTVSEFPYKTTVNSNNFPIKITMSSNTNLYSENVVSPNISVR